MFSLVVVGWYWRVLAVPVGLIMLVVLGVSKCKEHAVCLDGGLACGGGCFAPLFPHVSNFNMAS